MTEPADLAGTSRVEVANGGHQSWFCTVDLYCPVDVLPQLIEDVPNECFPMLAASGGLGVAILDGEDLEDLGIDADTDVLVTRFLWSQPDASLAVGLRV